MKSKLGLVSLLTLTLCGCGNLASAWATEQNANLPSLTAPVQIKLLKSGLPLVETESEEDFAVAIEFLWGRDRAFLGWDALLEDNESRLDIAREWLGEEFVQEFRRITPYFRRTIHELPVSEAASTGLALANDMAPSDWRPDEILAKQTTAFLSTHTKIPNPPISELKEGDMQLLREFQDTVDFHGEILESTLDGELVAVGRHMMPMIPLGYPAVWKQGETLLLTIYGKPVYTLSDTGVTHHKRNQDERWAERRSELLEWLGDPANEQIHPAAIRAKTLLERWNPSEGLESAGATILEAILEAELFLRRFDKVDDEDEIERLSVPMALNLFMTDDGLEVPPLGEAYHEMWEAWPDDLQDSGRIRARELSYRSGSFAWHYPLEPRQTDRTFQRRFPLVPQLEYELRSGVGVTRYRAAFPGPLIPAVVQQLPEWSASQWTDLDDLETLPIGQVTLRPESSSDEAPEPS